MLRLMRDYATSWMIKFILGAIVIVFVFWGVGSWREDRAARVALVNDQAISLDEYREVYNNLVEQIRRSFGNALNDEILKALNVRQQALDRLINETLLVQQAEAMEFKVSDEELASAIRNMTAFQNSGVFDNRLYHDILNRYRMTPEQFEVAQRKAMLAEKVRRFVIQGVVVSDDEALQWYRWQNAEVGLDFVRFSPDAYTDVTVADPDVRARFDKDSSPYKTEPKIKARFIRFDPDTYRVSISVDDGEVRQYYGTHPDEFQTPETVEARHILFKLDQGAAADVVEAKRQKALEVLKLARSGSDFAELARKYSEGPSKDQGGYLGTFKREEMVAPFSEAAFSMKAGEISVPVLTRFGWHLIKVEKINPAQQIELKEATARIRDKLIDAKAKALALDEAETVYDMSFEGDDLFRSAAERHLTVVTTDFFTVTGPASGVKNRVEFAKAAFALNPKEISEVKDLGDGYYLIQALEKEPAKIPEFESVKDRVRADILQEKRREKAKADAEAFLAALRSGASMIDQSRARGLKVEITGFFKRGGQIPELGYAPEIVEAAFLLTEKNPLPDRVLQTDTGYCVIRRTGRKDPGSDGFQDQKGAILRALTQQKEQGMFSEWLTQVRAGSTITIEEEFLQ